LDFASADDILVITSAGVPKYNGQTSQDAIEAIYNYQFKNGMCIPYHNVLMLRHTAVDTIDFAFITKKGNELKAVIYENTSKTPTYIGTISENMTKAQWNNYFNALSGENAWAFASLTNAWAAGAPNIILQEAAFHGHVCEGTLGGYSIVQALLTYYSPVSDVDYYDILGVPGGSDDDAVIYFLDATPGKIGDVGINMRLNGYMGFNTTSTGASENMIGFIRWGATTGTLVIMDYNKTKNSAAFQKETGIDPKSGSLEELKYNTWWVKNIKNNSEKVALLKEILLRRISVLLAERSNALQKA
jgi:formylmethanofuran dehydrogenase subunit E-like metal-binding protein